MGFLSGAEKEEMMGPTRDSKLTMPDLVHKKNQKHLLLTVNIIGVEPIQ